MAGEAFSHPPLNPIHEVLRAWRAFLTRHIGFDVAIHAVDDGFFGEVTDAVFKGVWHPAIMPADTGLAVGLHDGVVAAGHINHPFHHVLVLGEHDVATSFVEGETVYDL